MVAFNGRTLNVLGSSVEELRGEAGDWDSLLAKIGDARFVLIGEASHGTHEFYQARAQITQRLIEEKGFNAVVVEADWPDAWRVNRFVRGFNDDESADDALGGFKRFPQWMWRNRDVLEFITWLRNRNSNLIRATSRCGFYGMDLYSLYGSIEAVLRYLEKTDHEAATRARFRYACFDQFHENPQAYGYAAGFDLSESCERGVLAQLLELRAKASVYAKRDGRVAEDEYFYAEQNARLIANAERYYRSMFEGRVSSWNLRDRHMVETLEQLVNYLDTHVGRTKVVVWAHNSHLGDARATEMGAGGEVNVGQLVREKWGERETFLTGFSTYTGTVTAADDWDEPAQFKRVRPGLEGSYEELFHRLDMPRFILSVRDASPAMRKILSVERLQRAIGVVYRPQTERMSHYFNTQLLDQFDAMIHIDQTTALEPLERVATEIEPEVPETYPSGV